MRYLPYLSDDVVIVRPWKVDDARAVVAGYREPEISYWSGMPSPFTFGYALAWIGDAEAAWADGNDAHLAIVDAASGRVVGAIGLLGVDSLASFGRFRYWVRTARRGHGFARHALALVAAWARDDLGLERLEVATAVADAGAQQVARAVGFRPEAIYRSYRQLGEHRTDYYIYALPMPSWHVGPDFVDGIEQAEVAEEHERPASEDVVLPAAPPILAGRVCVCGRIAPTTWRHWWRRLTKRPLAGSTTSPGRTAKTRDAGFSTLSPPRGLPTRLSLSSPMRRVTLSSAA